MGGVRATIHKLGYSYKKGYIFYSKMPKDAKIILKKRLRFYDPKTRKFYLLDQVATQNLSNSPRTICKTSKKNILIQNPDKYSRTGIGLQGINGESYISFPPNSRKKEMIKFFMEVRQRDSKSNYLINWISELLEYENLKISEIIEELEQNTIEDSLLKNMLLNYVYPDKSEKHIIKDLKEYVEKEKMTKKYETSNKKKLEEILENLYVALLGLLTSSFSSKIFSNSFR